MTMKVMTTLNWRVQSRGLDGHRIYRAESPIESVEGLEPIATVGPLDTEYKELLENGKTYYYRVSAFKGNIEHVSLEHEHRTEGLSTGPGPQELIGHNGMDGFFGEVPVSQLINGTELASMIGLTAGTAQNTTDPWLKFIIDGKIYFVAKKNYRHSVSWDHIHTANAVYGDRILQIGDYRYRIGLLKGADTDPATYAGGGYNPPGTLESEWNRLMYNVANDLPALPKAGQIGENWAEYDQTDVVGGLNVSAGNGRRSWCQETRSSNAGHRVCRGDDSVTYSDFFSSSSHWFVLWLASPP